MVHKDQGDKVIKIEKILQDIKEAVHGHINAINPCEICENEKRDNGNKLEECKKCCFYYPSRFEPKKAE